jgi:hypothetical protein
MPRGNKLRLHRLLQRPSSNNKLRRLRNLHKRTVIPNLTDNHKAATLLMVNNSRTMVPRHKAILNNNSPFIRTNSLSRQA